MANLESPINLTYMFLDHDDGDILERMGATVMGRWAMAN